MVGGGRFGGGVVGGGGTNLTKVRPALLTLKKFFLSKIV